MSRRYWLDKKIRSAVMRICAWVTPRSKGRRVDLRRQEIKKILLVRSIFRMGDSILATPAILLLRNNFPAAQIDFVGPRVSAILFRHLPIDNHHEVYQSFPRVCWSYVSLLKQIRSARYDLAIDVSGSNAALGAFIVGFSGARFRAGLRGKYDRWFNLRFSRPAQKNKYRNLPELIGSMGLETRKVFPTLVLSAEEKECGTRRIDAVAGPRRDSVVGIFVGGRRTRGKRWPGENFLELAARLRAAGVKVVLFAGPEEVEVAEYLRQAPSFRVPVVSEPDVRNFASMVSNCDLFVACDSGPVHLACALRVRTVAIFLKNDFDRWGPPASLARIVYRETGVLPADVLQACRLELADLSAWNARQMAS